ncbi:MAG: zinc-dependent metalloprotease [Saprospiraceae bacterium]|nr:zinc-dependent metalloprotease [Saprospiraceae bacterium]
MKNQNRNYPPPNHFLFGLISLKSIVLLFTMIISLNLMAQNAQGFCGTEMSDPPILPPPVGTSSIDCYPEVAGPLIVRIKPHVIRTSAGTGGQSEGAIRNAIAKMRANYAPFDIYFFEVEDCVISTVDDDQYFYSDVLSNDILNNLESQYGDDNQIDIFFFPEEYLLNWQGLSLGPNGSTLAIGGEYITVYFLSVIESNTLSHEMGHSLGLYHTFQNVTDGSLDCSCENLLNQNPLDDYCCNCGDLVCDTRYYPVGIVPFVDPDDCSFTGSYTLPGCNNVVVTNPMVDNIMNYTAPECATEFTPGQVARMRYVINTTLQNVWAGSLDNAYGVLDLSAPFTSWSDQTITIYDRLTIKSGATLNLDHSKIAFGRNAKLIVEPNAVLNMKSTKLTSLCQDFWDGVEVHGTGGATNQFPNANGQYAQGRLITIGRSVIENAKIGVRLWGGSGNGGQINAYGATFKNNYLAVAARDYSNNIPPMAPSASQAGNRDYSAIFRSCRFVTDDSYRPILEESGYAFETFVQLQRVKGVRFFGCNFENTQSSPCLSVQNQNKCRGEGIKATNAGFWVTSAFSGSPNEKSLFKGLDKGIIIENALAVRPATVNSSTFSQNVIGIHVNNSANAIITGNNFMLGKLPYFPVADIVQTGTITTQASTFIYSNNQFAHEAGGFNITSVGTCNYSVQSANNLVRRNKYTDIDFANVYNGNNGSLPGQITSGLQYECNDNTSVKHYDFTAQKSGDLIRSTQQILQVDPNTGQTIIRPVGNTFSHQGDCEYSDFNAGTAITYFYNPTDPDQVPIFHNIASPQLSSNSTNCDPFVEAEFPLSEGDMGQVRNNFLLQSGLYHNARSAWKNALQSGNISLAEQNRQAAGTHLYLMQREAQKGYFHSITDTLTFSEDSVATWMYRMESVATDLDLALLNALKDQDAASTAILNQMPTRFDLSPEEQDDVQDMQIIVGILAVQNPDALDNTAQQTLLNLAQKPVSKSSMTAKGLLQPYGFIFPSVSCGLPECATNDRAESDRFGKAKIIKTYPNPAHDRIVFEGNFDQTEKIAVFNAQGLLVASLYPTTNNLQVVLPTGALLSGLYFWRAVTAEGYVQGGNFVVAH